LDRAGGFDHENFSGFLRIDRRAGTRNDVWIIPASRDVYSWTEEMLRVYRKPYWIDRVFVPEASYDFLRGDLDEELFLLAGLSVNPNAACALVVGRNDGRITPADIMKRVERELGYLPTHMESIAVDDLSGEESREKFLFSLDELTSQAARTRKGFSVRGLRVGLIAEEAPPPRRAMFTASKFAELFGGSVITHIGADAEEASVMLAARGAQAILSASGKTPRSPIVPIIQISPDDKKINPAALPNTPEREAARLLRETLTVCSGGRPRNGAA
jgi:altronate dehydratase